MSQVAAKQISGRPISAQEAVSQEQSVQVQNRPQTSDITQNSHQNIFNKYAKGDHTENIVSSQEIEITRKGNNSPIHMHQVSQQQQQQANTSNVQGTRNVQVTNQNIESRTISNSNEGLVLSKLIQVPADKFRQQVPPQKTTVVNERLRHTVTVPQGQVLQLARPSIQGNFEKKIEDHRVIVHQNLYLTQHQHQDQRRASGNVLSPQNQFIQPQPQTQTQTRPVQQVAQSGQRYSQLGPQSPIQNVSINQTLIAQHQQAPLVQQTQGSKKVVEGDLRNTINYQGQFPQVKVQPAVSQHIIQANPQTSPPAPAQQTVITRPVELQRKSILQTKQIVLPPSVPQTRRYQRASYSYSPPPRITFGYIISPRQSIIQQQVVHNVVTTTTVIWEERFFFIVERFEFFSKRFQIITQEYVEFWSQFESAKTSEEYQKLKIKYKNLLDKINDTQQQLSTVLQQNKNILTQETNWKLKYESLLKEFEELKKNSPRSVQSDQANHNLTLLQSHITELEQHYEKLAGEYKKKETYLIDAQKYIEQLIQENNRLKRIIESQPQSSTERIEQQSLHQELTQLYEMIQKKEKEIIILQETFERERHKNQPQNIVQLVENFNKEIAQKNSIILSIKLDNEAMKLSIQNFESQMAKLNQRDVSLKDEIARLNEVIRSNKPVPSQKPKQIIKEVIKEVYVSNDKTYKEQISRLNELISYYKETVQKISKQQQQPKEVVKEVVKEVIKEVPIKNDNTKDLQSEIARLKLEIKKKDETSEADLKIFNMRITELTDKIKFINNQKENSLKILQEKVNLLESDLNKKESLVRSLRDTILQLEEEKKLRAVQSQVPQQNQGFYQEIEHLRKLVVQREKELHFYEEKIIQYENNFKITQENINKKTVEITNYKRQIEDFVGMDNQIGRITEQFNKRNNQILELKNQLFEKDKSLKDLQLLQKENERLTQIIKKKNSEFAELTDKLYILERKSREAQNSIKSPRVDHWNEERQLLQNAIKKKDQELIKLRQQNQLLQSNIDEYEFQLQKIKNRANTLQKNRESDKVELKDKINQLENKLSQYEKKISSLQQVRNILQLQSNNLTAQHQNKIQTIQKLELQLRNLKGKLKTLQGENEDQQTEIDELNKKIKELNQKINGLNRQILSNNQNKKSLTNTNKTELVSLNNKYMELQALGRAKDNRIKDLERQLESLNLKMRTFDQNFEQIEYLNSKISEYESKLMSINISKTVGLRVPDYESNQIFQRKVIYELKMENDALRKQLGLNPGRFSSPSKKHKQNGQIVPSSDKGDKQVQKRLADFNERLEDLIKDHKYEQNGYKKETSDELYKAYERDRRALIERHNEEISQLKVRILELQNSSSDQPRFKYPSNKTLNPENIYTQQLQFYKQKNKELQERVDNHIKVNKQLKESLQNLMRGGNQEYSLSYYKDQIDRLNQTISQLQLKLKKSTEQLRRTKEENLKNSTRLNDNNATFELENKINDLNRRVTQLTMQNGLLQKQRNSKFDQSESFDKELRRLKILVEQANSSRDASVKILKEKEGNYETEVVKLNNRIKILQAEVERLNQSHQKRNAEGSNEIKTSKIRISELQQEIKKYKILIEEYMLGKENYQRDIVKFENQNRILQTEIQRLNESALVFAKRQKDIESESQSLRMKIAEYENQFRLLKSNSSTYEYQRSQYQQELVRLANQIKILESQISRINEANLKKLKQKENEISNLKNQNLDQTVSLKGFEENYEREVVKLENQIKILQSQRQRLNDSTSGYSKRIKDLQTQVTNLKAIIAQYETDLKSFKSRTNSFEYERSQNQQKFASYQETLSLLKKEINQLKINLSSKNEQLSNKQTQIWQLKRKITQSSESSEEIRLLKLKYDNLVHSTSNIRYEIEFIRNSLIELQTLIEELEKHENPALVKEQIKSNVSKSLNECRQITDALQV